MRDEEADGELNATCYRAALTNGVGIRERANYPVDCGISCSTIERDEAYGVTLREKVKGLRGDEAGNARRTTEGRKGCKGSY